MSFCSEYKDKKKKTIHYYCNKAAAEILKKDILEIKSKLYITAAKRERMYFCNISTETLYVALCSKNYIHYKSFALIGNVMQFIK